MPHPASLSLALASAPPPLVPREGANSTMVLVFQLLAIFTIFYFILIRPQRKERMRHQAMLSELARGDQVMTSGGILGVIVHATDKALTIKTGEDTRLVVDRGHISRKIEAE